ncbi:hypothetical protein EDEG_02954, partial [Edhazardia aedis USNM 41457]
MCSYSFVIFLVYALCFQNGKSFGSNGISKTESGDENKLSESASDKKTLENDQKEKEDEEKEEEKEEEGKDKKSGILGLLSSEKKDKSSEEKKMKMKKMKMKKRKM